MSTKPLNSPHQPISGDTLHVSGSITEYLTLLARIFNLVSQHSCPPRAHPVCANGRIDHLTGLNGCMSLYQYLDNVCSGCPVVKIVHNMEGSDSCRLPVRVGKVFSCFQLCAVYRVQIQQVWVYMETKPWRDVRNMCPAWCIPAGTASTMCHSMLL
jgi:hypothetical protein